MGYLWCLKLVSGDIHDHDVLGHRALLVFGHPYSLSRLASLCLGHDIELGSEEVIQQGGLSGRLRAEHGDEVVVEACIGDIGALEIFVQRGAGRNTNVRMLEALQRVP